MSDFRAIGGVSNTLQTLLMDRMELPDGAAGVPVTIGPPPFTAKDNEPHHEDARVNLFLYRVTENGHLQNQEIPGRGTGNGYGHPPLSLNLHYLVTAYGNVEKNFGAGTPLLDDTTAHHLLGSAMRVLHDTTIVTQQLRTMRPPSGLTILHPTLRDGYDGVKLTLEPLTLEDVTKVWTALALRYRLSAAYVVNVVQIESRRPTVFPRPVGAPTSSTPPLPNDPPSPGPWVYTLPIQSASITSVSVLRLGDTVEQPMPYARVGDTLVLRGTSLTGRVTEGMFGDLVVPATVAAPDVVHVVVPDATVAGNPIRDDLLVQPGPRVVRLRHRDPLVPHSSVGSNEAVFMLVPGVDPAQVVYAAGPPRQVTIGGSRLVSPGGGGQCLIGRAAVPQVDYLSASPTSIAVPVPTTLPKSGVRLLLGGSLPDPVPIGGGPHSLTVTIGGVSRSASWTGGLPASIPRADTAALVASLVHDATAPGATPDRRFTAARVDLWGDQLVLIPGDLTSTIAVAAAGPNTLAAPLGLTVAPPLGAGSAAVSGLLTVPPALSATHPRLSVTIGAQTRTIDVPRDLTALEDLAVALETALHGVAGGGGNGFSQCRVGTSAGQLVLMPGDGTAVSFAATADDATTVRELQWHARFAVRVRCNGAESIDDASVELPA